MGLWKPVFLHMTKGISLSHPMVLTTNLAKDYSSADLNIMIQVTNHLPKMVAGTLIIGLPSLFSHTINQTVFIPPSSSINLWVNQTDHDRLSLTNPKLWFLFYKIYKMIKIFKINFIYKVPMAIFKD